MKKVFISYSWNDSTLVQETEKYLQSFGITCVRDVRDLKPLGSIMDFMKRIRSTDYVLLIISDSFLRSFNCMKEIIELLKDDNYKNRIIPVIVGKLNIFQSEGFIEYINYWENESNTIKLQIEKIQLEHQGNLIKRLNIVNHIAETLSEFIETLNDIKCIEYDTLKESNYKIMLDILGLIDNQIIIEIHRIENISIIEEQEIELEKLIIKYPGNKELLLYRGIKTFLNKNYLKASIYFENYVDIDSKNPTPFNYLGVIYMHNLSKYDKSEHNFRKAIEIDPNNDTAINNLGILYYDYLDKKEEAKKLFEKAIEINKANDSAYSNLGRYYGDTEINVEKALGLYEIAIVIDPTNSNAYYNIGHIYEFHYRDYDNAINNYEHSIRYNQDNFSAHVRLGVLSVEYLNDYEKAFRHYIKVIELNPDDYIALSNLGYIYHERNEFENAIECYVRSLKIKPDYTSARCNLANIYNYQLKDYEKAKSYYDECLKVDKNNAIVHINYSQIYDQAQKNQKKSPISFLDARDHYLTAIKLNRALKNKKLDEYFH